MNIANSPALQTALAAVQGPVTDALGILVLKKALNQQSVAATALLQALPAVPALATSGALGTLINTFA